MYVRLSSLTSTLSSREFKIAFTYEDGLVAELDFRRHVENMHRGRSPLFSLRLVIVGWVEVDLADQVQRLAANPPLNVLLQRLVDGRLFRRLLAIRDFVFAVFIVDGFAFGFGTKREATEASIPKARKPEDQQAQDRVDGRNA